MVHTFFKMCNIGNIIFVSAIDFFIGEFWRIYVFLHLFYPQPNWWISR